MGGMDILRIIKGKEMEFLRNITEGKINDGGRYKIGLMGKAKYNISVHRP